MALARPEVSLNQITYEAKLSEYQKISKNWVPLHKHVYLFLEPNGQTYSVKSVTAGLELLRSNKASEKGAAFSAFHATHASGGVCPVLTAEFKKHDANGYGNFLHLGTTRIYKADGQLDEKRWEEFEKYVTQGQNEEPKIVVKSKLFEYLNKKNDVPEEKTGRHTLFQRLPFLSALSPQKSMAINAWNEIFDRLASGWELIPGTNGEYEPSLTRDDVRLLFADTPAVLLKVVCGLLPVPKPTVQVADAKMTLAKK